MTKVSLIVFIWFQAVFLLHGQKGFEQLGKSDLTRIEKEIKHKLELGSKFLYLPESHKADIDSATYYFDAALKRSKYIRNIELEYETLFYFGEVCYERNEFDKGNAYYNKIINHYKKTNQKAKEAKILYSMGCRMFFQIPKDKINYSEIAEIFNRSAKLYEELNLKVERLNSLIYIGDISLNEGKLELANIQLLEVLDLYKSIGHQDLHHTYRLLSVTHQLSGNLDKSLYYALEAVKSVEKSNNKSSTFYYYKQLADIYMELQLYEKSIEWYKKSNLISQDKNISYYYRSVDLISKCLLKLGRNQEALNSILDAVKKYPPQTSHNKAIIYLVLGNYYKTIKRYDLAEKNYTSALFFFEEIKNDIYPKILSHAYIEVGSFYIEQKEYLKAKAILEKALEIPEGITGISSLSDANLMLFKVDSAQANYPSAIKYYQKYKALNDSVFNEKKSKRIEELQVLYETEKQKKDIDTLQDLTTFQMTKLEHLGKSLSLIIGVLVLLSVIFLLLIKSYTTKQKSNRMLISQKGEIDQKNTSLQKLVLEKEWLLKEVHHRVKNNLQIVMSLLNTQSHYLKDNAALNAIQESQHRIYSMSLIHKKLYQTENVIAINMEIYCKEMIEYFKNTFDIGQRIQFMIDVEPIELDSSQAVPLGLILNEAITNSIKHAFTNKNNGIITVTFKHLDNNRLQLFIKDNGIGILENSDDMNFQSLGMKLIKGFSEDLDAELHIKNDNGLLISLNFLYNEKMAEVLVNQV